MLVAVACLGGVLAGLGVYAWFEAGWLRTRILEVRITGLPEAVDGLRIAHLSDFHLGAPFSRGNGASERAAAWVAARRPDLVCITGDLVSHPRGEERLRRLLAGLERPLVVLGNHDVAVTRDPFSKAAELSDLARAMLLRDEGTAVRVRGESISIVGVDPVSYRAGTAKPEELADPDAALRLLLCHFPRIVRTIPAGRFDLVLAGHLHAGQLCLPLPGGRLALAHPRAAYLAGLYETPVGMLHVSSGTGTTFVPFRFFARPEATELVLRRRG
jgi:predicted MPP superfamily phosphohydrolase